MPTEDRLGTTIFRILLGAGFGLVGAIACGIIVGIGGAILNQFRTDGIFVVTVLTVGLIALPSVIIGAISTVADPTNCVGLFWIIVEVAGVELGMWFSSPLHGNMADVNGIIQLVIVGALPAGFMVWLKSRFFLKGQPQPKPNCLMMILAAGATLAIITLLITMTVQSFSHIII